MPRMDKLSDYRTTISGNAGTMRVTYHSTTIVEWSEDRITLRTGGWDTVTTRRKMNQTSRQFGLGFSVFRDDNESFVTWPCGKTEPLGRNTTWGRACSS